MFPRSLPALAVCEAQVHAVAAEEGAGVQRELHAGRVRDGLAQQGHHSGCRGRRRAAQRSHVTCAVHDLKQDPFKITFSYQVQTCLSKAKRVFDRLACRLRRVQSGHTLRIQIVFSFLAIKT